MEFEFATAGRILFGDGARKEVAPAAAAVGRAALVVTGSSPQRSQWLFDALAELGVGATSFSVVDEPTVPLAVAGAEAARTRGAQVVIGVGGGSAIDAAKAIAALATNPADPYDYLEVIGRAQPLPNAPLPIIAVPTTAGTGSEVTRNAVLLAPNERVKVSLRSPLLLPRLAVVDPELTWTTPPDVTAAAGMDALTQLIEPFTGGRRNAIVDALCRDALPRVARALERLYADGADRLLRREMAWGSLCGGLALANAGLGAVHGIAGPFGGEWHAPHGAVCAALVGPVVAINLAKLRTFRSMHPTLQRYTEVAQLCLGDAARAEELVEWLLALREQMNIPGLSHYGFGPEYYDDLIPKALASSSMKNNPVLLSPAEVGKVLNLAL